MSEDKDGSLPYESPGSWARAYAPPIFFEGAAERRARRRDMFAAAALTGLLANHLGVGNFRQYAVEAFALAAAMLDAGEE